MLLVSRQRAPDRIPAFIVERSCATRTSASVGRRPSQTCIRDGGAVNQRLGAFHCSSDQHAPRRCGAAVCRDGAADGADARKGIGEHVAARDGPLVEVRDATQQQVVSRWRGLAVGWMRFVSSR